MPTLEIPVGVWAGVREDFTLCFALYLWTWRAKEIRLVVKQTNYEWLVICWVPAVDDIRPGESL